MELRSCDNTHFIQTVRGGLVIKVRNTDSRGKPALTVKAVKDVYAAEDAKKLERSSPTDDHNRQESLMANSEQVECEVQFVPVADRMLREADECVPDADDGLDSDLDDETTLTQLRKRYMMRKRKFCHIISDENANRASANEKAVEDESDLNEPLINWKSKNLKGSKAKRKRRSVLAVSGFNITSAVKSEENHLSESSLQVGCELIPILSVKVEVQDADELENQNRTFSADPLCHAQDEEPIPVPESSDDFQMVEYEYGELAWPANERETCVSNESSDEYVEDVEPLYMLVPLDGMSIKLEAPDFDYQDPPILAIGMGSEVEETYSPRSSPSSGSSEVYCPSGGSPRTEELSEHSSCSGSQVPNIASEGTGMHGELSSMQFENKFWADTAREQDDSLCSPSKKNGCSSQDSNISLPNDNNSGSREFITAEAEPPSTCTFDTIIKDGLNHAVHLEDKPSYTEQKQTSASSITDVERQSCLESQTFDIVDTQLTQESHQTPERLFSTRKAISPTSQEKLRLAMSSIVLCDDDDQCKSEGKHYGKQTGKRASPVRSNVQQAKVAINNCGNGKVGRRKVVISPRQIIKKSQNGKGNAEAPRFSRNLPNLYTGCTSIEGCSESAIAFSQRQLHNMETLVEKLMNELKSMKDIVEQKLLFEAYRNVSLRNDADEVKSVINNAVKVEEAAQKWLSMMARDCHRFCKIMKLTPNGPAASKDAVPRQNRKIVFADEAGGKLCQVKVFDVGVADDIKQEEHSL